MVQFLEMNDELLNDGPRFRILMVAPTSFFADYGCHVRILEEAQALQALGHTVTIATYHNGGPIAGLDIRRSLWVPGRRRFEVGSSRHKIAFDALLGARILALLARQRFDVIHGHLHEGALMGLVLGRLRRIPTVFDFQGSMTGEMLDHGFLKSNGKLYEPMRRLETWIDRHSPVVFTSSANARSLLVGEFGCASDRVSVLPDAVNGEKFRPAATYAPGELAGLAASLGIPEDRRLIVYLGLLAEYQGTGLLLEAMARLAARYEDAHLLLMGFPNVERYRLQAESLGISNRVTFTGRVPYERAPQMLALGDVAVSPKLSLTEGAGKLLNYMAVGLPTVSFDTPVAREYLGADGLYAEPGKVDSLADQLGRALFPAGREANLARASGARLRARALECYRWDSVALQITRAYEVALGRVPASAPTRNLSPGRQERVPLAAVRPDRR
jgi:glycosyltransferase involved in cell wall biosynthesis